MYAVDVRPLRLVFATEYDAVEMLGLDAQNAAGCQDRMIDFREAAVGAGQYEVVQDVFAAFRQSSADPELSDRASDIERYVISHRSKYKGQQQGAGDREKKHSWSDACDSGLHAAVSREGGYRD